MGATSYQPRAMEGTILHRVVREHFETFRAEIAARTEGSGLPSFVEREFREFVTCGVLSRGFARVRCGNCAFERLVPFSCKRRGFCPRYRTASSLRVEHAGRLDRQWLWTRV